MKLLCIFSNYIFALNSLSTTLLEVAREVKKVSANVYALC